MERFIMDLCDNTAPSRLLQKEVILTANKKQSITHLKKFREEPQKHEIREKELMSNSGVVSGVTTMKHGFYQVCAPQTLSLIMVILQARKERILLHSRCVFYINFKVMFILSLLLAVIFNFFSTLEQLIWRSVYTLMVKRQKTEERL